MAKQPANLADPGLLEKIDKFFELGIGEYVALPQVRLHPTLRFCIATKHCSVTCCGRSVQVISRLRRGTAHLLTTFSGKSSVLEGLTGLPYPRDSGLCTRFATQITFRRTPTKKIAVSIIPAENAPSDYAEKLRAWRKDDLVSLELQTFADILKEVGSHYSRLATGLLPLLIRTDRHDPAGSGAHGVRTSRQWGQPEDLHGRRTKDRDLWA